MSLAYSTVWYFKGLRKLPSKYAHGVRVTGSIKLCIDHVKSWVHVNLAEVAIFPHINFRKYCTCTIEQETTLHWTMNCFVMLKYMVTIC